MLISSRVKIWSFRGKAHLVFHWCLYNKKINYIPTQTYFQLLVVTNFDGDRQHPEMGLVLQGRKISTPHWNAGKPITAGFTRSIYWLGTLPLGSRSTYQLIIFAKCKVISDESRRACVQLPLKCWFFFFLGGGQLFFGGRGRLACCSVNCKQNYKDNFLIRNSDSGMCLIG